jgi:hypothetical protein
VSKTYGKRDAGHFEIKTGLINAGRPVKDCAGFAGLGCDLIAEHVDGYAMFLEVKKPGPPSVRNRLSPSEIELRSLFPQFYRVVQSVEEALAAVGLAV